MAFFGVFGGNREARACFEERAAYLFAPALHFSIDGKVAFCHDEAKTLEELARNARFLFVASASPTNVVLGRDRLALLYRRYGKRLRRYIPCPSSFALYDARGGFLLLGGTHGVKCFAEELSGAILFSSDPYLLRAPTPLDLALLK